MLMGFCQIIIREQSTMRNKNLNLKINMKVSTNLIRDRIQIKIGFIHMQISTKQNVSKKKEELDNRLKEEKDSFKRRDKRWRDSLLNFSVKCLQPHELLLRDKNPNSIRKMNRNNIHKR